MELESTFVSCPSSALCKGWTNGRGFMILLIGKGIPGREKHISKGRRHRACSQEVNISGVKVMEGH